MTLTSQFATPAIDVHHHFLPPFYKDAAGDWLRSIASNAEEALAWTPERSLAAMDAARIETSVLSISAPGVTGFARAPEIARDCNAYGAAMCKEHGARFKLFACLPMPDVSASLSEIDHALAHNAPVGFGLLTNYDGRYLGEPDFAPVFERLDALNATVYVHPTLAPCCKGILPILPDPLIEFPVDTARAIASLLWSGTLSRHPNIRFVFSHDAGVLPMVLERVAAAGFINRELGARVPEGAFAALARIYVDTASVTYPAAFNALDTWLPAANILYGTDYPWGRPDAARAALARLGLSPERLDAIERGNCAALLNL